MRDELVRDASCNLGHATEEWVVGGWLWVVANLNLNPKLAMA